ncbi:MAG: hypothetical protein KDC05_02755 [Bacteroidales bacterium]|nr:hypothetical protein [Bacteroidales bacterium]
MKNKQLILCLLIFTQFSMQSQTDNDSGKSLIRGIYKNFYEFKTNSPQITDPFIIDSVPRDAYRWTGTYSRSLFLPGEKDEIEDVWGFCDGRNCYIRFRGDYFPIFYDDGDFGFVGFGVAEEEIAINGFILGGLTGYAIMKNSARISAKNKKHTYYIHPVNGNPFESRFSMKQYEDPEFVTLVLYRGHKHEIEQHLNFVINDTLFYSFPPGSFAEFDLDNDYKPVELKIGDNHDQKLRVYPAPFGKNYYRLSFSEEDSIPVVEQVDKATGEFEGTKALNKQKKRNK